MLFIWVEPRARASTVHTDSAAVHTDTLLPATLSVLYIVTTSCYIVLYGSTQCYIVLYIVLHRVVAYALMCVVGDDADPLPVIPLLLPLPLHGQKRGQHQGEP
jgi:hypothetical protein